jgi:hypothetical protein
MVTFAIPLLILWKEGKHGIRIGGEEIKQKGGD